MVEISGIEWNDRAEVFAWFLKRFAGWSPIWHELFKSENMYIVPGPCITSRRTNVGSHFPT